jgi:hypothetical protein
VRTEEPISFNAAYRVRDVLLIVANGPVANSAAQASGRGDKVL